jgi:hypothetical protein
MPDCVSAAVTMNTSPRNGSEAYLFPASKRETGSGREKNDSHIQNCIFYFPLVTTSF